jgi:dihydroxyacetone kinase-like protein
MPEIGFDELVLMLRGAGAQVRAHHDELSRLDSCGGDGDHGTTMLRAMERLESAVTACAEHSPQKLLKDVGWAIMGVDGGATGPLFGTLFTAMAQEAAGRDSFDSAALAGLFEAGLAGVQKRTKAQPGDKTLLDALSPAVAAMRRATDEGAGAREVLQAGAEAAAQGAEATAAMQARFGRARNVGEKSIGAPDAGATSMALCFKGFVEGLN